MAGAIQYESGTDMATEASYPYTATDGTSKSSFTAAILQAVPLDTSVLAISFLVLARKTCSPQSSSSQCRHCRWPLSMATVDGHCRWPLSMAIEVDQYAFQDKSGGVVVSSCGTSLDPENNQDCRLVNNSWGDHGVSVAT